MVGSEDNNRIFIQSQVFQRFQNLTEGTVNSRYGSKIVTGRFCLFHLQVYVRTNQQAIQRFILVKVEILLFTVVQRTIRTMRRVHAYHNKERFLCIAHVTLIFQI